MIVNRVKPVQNVHFKFTSEGQLTGTLGLKFQVLSCNVQILNSRAEF